MGHLDSGSEAGLNIALTRLNLDQSAQLRLPKCNGEVRIRYVMRMREAGGADFSGPSSEPVDFNRGFWTTLSEDGRFLRHALIRLEDGVSDTR